MTEHTTAFLRAMSRWENDGGATAPAFADRDQHHPTYAEDVVARIGKVRAALEAVRRLGRQSDPGAHAPFGVLVEDMESYLEHLRKSHGRMV